MEIDAFFWVNVFWLKPWSCKKNGLFPGLLLPSWLSESDHCASNQWSSLVAGLPVPLSRTSDSNPKPVVPNMHGIRTFVYHALLFQNTFLTNLKMSII